MKIINIESNNNLIKCPKCFSINIDKNGIKDISKTIKNLKKFEIDKLLLNIINCSKISFFNQLIAPDPCDKLYFRFKLLVIKFIVSGFLKNKFEITIKEIKIKNKIK